MTPESEKDRPLDSQPDVMLKFPSQGRLAGVDFGTVRIGIAVTDPQQQIASPLEVYRRRNEKLDSQFFVDLVGQERVVGFVVGLPIHMSGDSSQKSKEAVEFGKWIQRVTNRPVKWVDERFSTAMAREILNQSGLSGKKKKARLDQIAAQVLLSTFLENPNAEIRPLE